MSKNFYENLKKARLNNGLSQAQLAELLGVAKSTYSMYESGKREPNIQTIRKIADILGVSVDELLGMDEICDYAMKVMAKTVEPQTIAAHFDGDEYTEEELEQIRQFAEFVKSRRNNLQSPPITKMTAKEASDHLGVDISKYINKPDNDKSN